MKLTTLFIAVLMPVTLSASASAAAGACKGKADKIGKLLEHEEFGPGWLNDEVALERAIHGEVTYSLSYEPMRADLGSENQFFQLVLDANKCQVLHLTRPGANLDVSRQLAAGLSGPCDPKAKRLVEGIHRITNPTADFIVDEVISESHNRHNWLVEVSVEHAYSSAGGGYSVVASSEACSLRQIKHWDYDVKPKNRLDIRGNDDLKVFVKANITTVNQSLNGKVDVNSLSCLGVLAEDAGDVSYPEDGVFGTCLARASLPWPDSDDTIVQITVTGEFTISTTILAEQL